MKSPSYNGYWNVNDFPRLAGEADDTNRIQRAVNAALSILTMGGTNPLFLDTTTIARTVYFPGSPSPYIITQAAPAGYVPGVYLNGGNATGGSLPARPACRYIKITVTGTAAAGNLLSINATTNPDAASVSVSVTANANETNASIAGRAAMAINKFANGAFAWAMASTNEIYVYFPEYPTFSWVATSTGGIVVSSTSPVQYASGIVSDPRIRLVGDGLSATTFAIERSNARLFYAENCSNSSVTGDTLLEFRDFSVISPTFPNSASTISGVVALDINGISSKYQMSRVYIENINFLFRGGSSSTAIKLSAAQGNRIEKIKSSLTTTGIILDNVSDTVISDSFFSGGTGPAVRIIGRTGDPSTDLHLGEGIFLSNIDANGQSIGLHITDHSFGTATGCSFSTCETGAVISSRSRIQLSTSSPSNIGATTMTFASTANLFVGLRVLGSSAIPEGATIVGLTGTTVTLSAALTASVAAATLITFLNPNSRTEGWQFSSCQFGATLNMQWRTSSTSVSQQSTPTLKMYYTNGITVGMRPVAIGIPPTAVIVAIDGSTNTLTLSENLTQDIGINSLVTIQPLETINVPTSAVSSVGTAILTFVSTKGIFRGMPVELPGFIPDNSIVADVSGTTVTINSSLLATIPATARVKFTILSAQSLQTSSATAAGSSILHFAKASTTNLGLQVGMPIFGPYIDKNTFVTAIVPGDPEDLIYTSRPMPFDTVVAGAFVTFLRTSFLQLRTSAISSGTSLYFPATDVGGITAGMAVDCPNLQPMSRVRGVSISGGTATVTLSAGAVAASEVGTRVSFYPISAISLDESTQMMQFSGCYFFDSPIGLTVDLASGEGGGGYHVVNGGNFFGLPSGGIVIRDATSCAISGCNITQSNAGLITTHGGFHTVSGCNINEAAGSAGLLFLQSLTCTAMGNTVTNAQRGALLCGGGFHTIGSCTFNGNSEEDVFLMSTISINITAASCMSSFLNNAQSIRDDPTTSKIIVNGVIVSAPLTLVSQFPVVNGVQTFP